jgi:alpha-amylase
MKRIRMVTLLFFCLFLVTACSKKETVVDEKQVETEVEAEVETIVVETTEEEQLPIQMMDDKYRNFYEIFVYSFYDSDGDGIGDFDGLTEKLDYLNDGNDQTLDDLGFNGIWLMPIMTSTTYHKYDVVDYYEIDPEYGTMDDFKEFMASCKERDIHVILDMVINHTSSKHPWFLEASTYLKNLGDGEVDLEECPYVDYYFFSKEKTSQTNCQLPGTDWYYEGRFWSEMPDLNLGSEAVRNEFTEIAKYWLDLGVAGFRLDAAKEFYSGNDTANIEVLSWYHEMVTGIKEDAYLVAEVWTDVNTYGKYYQSGIDSLFNFAFANSDGLIANTVKGNSKTINALVYGKSIAALDENLRNTMQITWMHLFIQITIWLEVLDIIQEKTG